MYRLSIWIVYNIIIKTDRRDGVEVERFPRMGDRGSIAGRDRSRTGSNNSTAKRHYKR